LKKICAFVGQRDVQHGMDRLLENVLTDLIENHQVSLFFVGDQGEFNRLVGRTLRKMQKKYVHIQYYVVLACMMPYEEDDEKTLVPPIMGETFLDAVFQRNRWMLSQATYIVSYVVNSIDDASADKEFALQHGKTVIELSELL